MRTSNLLIAAALMSSISFATLSAVPSNAQGPTAGNTSTTAPQVQQIPNVRMYKALTDANHGYKPVTLPSGETMGPNIPGNIVAGQLQPPPNGERIGVSIFFGLILIASGVWALMSFNEMTKILAQDFGTQRNTFGLDPAAGKPLK